MDGGESEGDGDGIATMKDFHEPLPTYISPYSQISKRSWSQSNILDETSDSYEPSSVSPLRAEEYDDVSEYSNNETDTGFGSVSPMVSGTPEMNTIQPGWLNAMTRPNTMMDSDVDEAASMKVDLEKPFESPQYDQTQQDEHPLAELFTEDTVPMQAQDSEEELQRSLQESLNRHKVLAMKMPWSPPPHALQHGPQPQPLPPEWVEEQYMQPVLYGDGDYDDEELKVSLMESVKRHSMLSRRRSSGLEEPQEPNEASWETGSSDSSESQEEEELESKVSVENIDKVIESRTEMMDAEMESVLEVKEECEENVEDEKTGYSDNNVNNEQVFTLAVSCSGGDSEGGCRKKRTLMREVRCLVNDDDINSLKNTSSTASPDRISRRLRPRSCARALKENPKEIEYLMNLLRDGGEGQCKPNKRMQGKGCKSGLLGNPMVNLNNHQKETVESCVSSSSGNTRARNSCRGKKSGKGSGIVVRAMLKRREKCKVTRPTSLSDQKKKAIRLKLALERKKLLIERRAALERELDTVVVDNVDKDLLAKATRRLDLEDRVQVMVASEDVCATMPCVKLEESQTPPQSSSCNISHVFLVAPCGTSYACGSVTLGPGSLQPAQMTLAQSVAEIYPLQFAVPVSAGVLSNQQGTVTERKPETLKDLAAKVSQGVTVAVPSTKDQEHGRVIEARTVEPQLRPECEDEQQEVNGQVVGVDVMVACETQKRGPGRRRKRGGKYPVLPKPVRLSRNGKKLGRPRTKNVQEHVEDFVRGATSITEPLSICLPQFNHLLQCNHEDQNNDGTFQGLESASQNDCLTRVLQETPEETATQYAEPEDERRVGCRAPKSTFRCKEIAVRQHDNFTQIVLVSTTKQRNALSVQALSELESVLQSARKDASCHVVLLSAPSGSMFCSGVDLQGLVSSDGHPVGHRVAFQASEALKAFLKTLVSFPKPVVAAVNGEAVGLGATLLPLCDVVYASDKATFRTLYGRIGQAPEGGATCTMPDLLGPARASELLLTGRKLTATEAFEQGLVSQVLWPATFMEQVIPRVRHLASQSVQFAETTKALMRCHQRARVEMAIEMECRLLASQWQSKECQNNIRNLIQQNELS